MPQTCIRFVTLVAVAAALALLGAGSTFADASATSQGTLTLSSDPGDWVGQGQQFSFATPGDGMSVGGSTHGFGIDIHDSSWLTIWSLRFEVPLGETLAVGTYANAQFMADETHPGISIEGEHRGCGTGTVGSFRVLAAEFGPYGYLEHIHATFEQHCDGAAPALRGELDAYAPTPAEPVQVHVTVDDSASLDRGDGKVTVHGTVRCSILTVAHVNAAIMQPTKKGPASASSGVLYIPECSPSPTTWQVTLASATPVRFAPGSVQATVDGQVMDEWYSAWTQNQPVIYATDHTSATVALTPGT